MLRFFGSLIVSAIVAFLPLHAQDPGPKVEVRYSAFNAVQVADTDATAVSLLGDPALRPEYVRYLSLHNYPAERRKVIKAVVDHVLNSLNPKYRRIVRTAGLPAGADAPFVLRVNLADYGIRPSAWNYIAENGSGQVPMPDMYFHTFLTNDLQVLPGSFLWTPAFAVSTERASTSNAGQVAISVPGECSVWFDGKLMANNVSTRVFTTPTLERGYEYQFEVRVAGSYQGQSYTLTHTVDIAAGRRVRLQMNQPIKGATTTHSGKDKVLASAPWLALEPNEADRGSTIAHLMALSNTKNPILRADWFVVNATLAPAYYELIGLDAKDNPVIEDRKKTPKVYLEEDFEQLFGFDFSKARQDIVAAITDTKIVTLHNRLIQRLSTVKGITGGYYYRSQDTDVGIDDEDYLNNIVRFDKPTLKAQEIIASGRNGMNFYALTDNKRRLVSVAAVTIAQHGDVMPTKFQDKQVFAARNCMLCHASGQIYLKDKVRNIARGKIALFIADKTHDQELAKKIDEAFSPDPKGILDLDNAKFAAAVIASSGLDGRDIGKALEELIYNYWDQPVTLERMAWEAGIVPAKLEAMLREGINLDYPLVGVLQDPPEPVSILPWQRHGFAALMQFCISHQPRGKQ